MKESATLMRIYTDERAKADGTPLVTEIVERARRFSVAGSTVLRAVTGFGASKNVQRASILDLSGNLPLVIELVDEEQKLRAFWKQLHGLTDIGLVTLEPLEVLHYGGRQGIESGVPLQPSRMRSFTVVHRASGRKYFLMANSEDEAVELVTLTLADLEGPGAWEASHAEPEFRLIEGEVYNASGQPIPRAML